jgi:hypothetical protein
MRYKFEIRPHSFTGLVSSAEQAMISIAGMCLTMNEIGTQDKTKRLVDFYMSIWRFKSKMYIKNIYKANPSIKCSPLLEELAGVL